MHRKFLRLQQKNMMHQSFLRLQQKNLLSLVVFMNIMDLCSNGVKLQKCEKTIARSAQYFKQFIPKYLVIQCTKPRGFSKQNSRILKKNLKAFRKHTMLRRLPASVSFQKNVQKLSLPQTLRRFLCQMLIDRIATSERLRIMYI